MVRFIDIDGTICITEGLYYENAKPIKERIEKINKWYEQGDAIVYYTARGCASNDRCRKAIIEQLTRRQLWEWGCKYHELRMDKPYFDLMYDDRAFNAMELDK